MDSSTQPGAVQHDALINQELSPSSEDPISPRSPPATSTDPTRSRESTTTSPLKQRLRGVSNTFSNSNPPLGFMIATAQIASSIPTVTDIRRGSFSSEGWSGEGQVREHQRRTTVSSQSSGTGEDTPRRKGSFATPASPRDTQRDTIPETVPEVSGEAEKRGLGIDTANAQEASMADPVMASSSLEKMKATSRSSADTGITPIETRKETDPHYRTTPFDNGYQFPPKRKWTESTVIGLKAAWKFTITPIGFLVVIYGLNVVAWGGMLFLLLCNASPAMCKPTCGNINSPRRIWIEIDSQILNALFCVTGFGLAPWRFRDLYYLLQYRVQKKELALRRLAGINRGWFRLAGSQDLPVSIGPAEVEAGAAVPQNELPFPLSQTPNAPLTGVRAPPTKMWKLDFVIWGMVWNTFLQAVLSGFMWGLNRYNRPSWSTGTFVALACIVAAAAGLMSFMEGKKVKAIEGVPVSEADMEKLRRDKELGIMHYNNINDEGPKAEKKAKENGLFHRKPKSEAVQIDERGSQECVSEVAK